MAWTGWCRESGRGWISDATRRTVEWEVIPDQQARVIVVGLRRLLGVLIDNLSWDTLERIWLWSRRIAVDAGLGLSVNEGWNRSELGVVSIVDCFDSVLFLELIDRKWRAS